MMTVVQVLFFVPCSLPCFSVFQELEKRGQMEGLSPTTKGYLNTPSPQIRVFRSDFLSFQSALNLDHGLRQVCS